MNVYYHGLCGIKAMVKANSQKDYDMRRYVYVCSKAEQEPA